MNIFLLLTFSRHSSLAVINSLQKIAEELDSNNPLKDDFLIHLLEIFVQLGLQARKISEKTHSKVSRTSAFLSVLLFSSLHYV